MGRPAMAIRGSWKAGMPPASLVWNRGNKWSWQHEQKNAKFEIGVIALVSNQQKLGGYSDLSRASATLRWSSLASPQPPPAVSLPPSLFFSPSVRPFEALAGHCWSFALLPLSSSLSFCFVPVFWIEHLNHTGRLPVWFDMLNRSVWDSSVNLDPSLQISIFSPIPPGSIPPSYLVWFNKIQLLDIAILLSAVYVSDIVTAVPSHLLGGQSSHLCPLGILCLSPSLSLSPPSLPSNSPSPFLFLFWCAPTSHDMDRLLLGHTSSRLIQVTVSVQWTLLQTLHPGFLFVQLMILDLFEWTAIDP